jgi:hypothetical protein
MELGSSYLIVGHSSSNFGVPVNWSAQFIAGTVRTQDIGMSIKWYSHHKLIRRASHVHPQLKSIILRKTKTQCLK